MALSHVGATVSGTSGSGASYSNSKSCTAGNSVLVLLMWYTSVTVSSLTCAGETISLVGSAVGNGSLNAVARSQWAIINNVQSTASKTISLTLSGTPSACAIHIFEIGGAATAGIVDVHAPVATGNVVANASTTITTTFNNSAVYGAYMHGSNSPATPGTGYTDLAVTGTGWSYEHVERTTSMDAGTAGAVTVGWTNGACDWHIDAIAIKAAGAVGGGANQGLPIDLGRY